MFEQKKNIMTNTTKYFSREIEKFYHLLKSRINFSFSKFADKEWDIIRNIPVSNSEFSYSQEDSFYRDKLIESFKFKETNYFVGISCPCCQGVEYIRMKEFSEQNENNLTFANVFVNNNYKFFVNNFFEEFKNWEIHLVANKHANISNLPFGIENFYPVENTAWKYNYDYIEEIIKQNHENKLFLFACGSFGNMLSHQLWDNNKKNTYIDIGSTLNSWTNCGGFVRGYQSEDNSDSTKICLWE